MKLYKINDVFELSDGAQIENPIWGWADSDQMNMNGENVNLRVVYFTGTNQTVPTHSRWYTFKLADVMAKIAEVGDIEKAGRELLLTLHENSEEI